MPKPKPKTPPVDAAVDAPAVEEQVKKPPKKKAGDDGERPIQYPELKLALCVGKNVITREIARDLLGWTTDMPEGFNDTDYLVKDEDYSPAKPVYCRNNNVNRPWDEAWSKALAQDVLRNNWKFNGEAIIISKTGLVQSGQHRLFALEFACQMWNNPAEHKQWKEFRAEEPTLESVVVFGTEEGNEFVRTLDNTKPRTLSDVLVTMGMFNRKLSKYEQIQLSKLAEHAVRSLWFRTAADINAFAQYRTHSESVRFIERHPHVLDAVSHIHKIDQKSGNKADVSSRKPVGRFISGGYASGLLYMQGASYAEGKKYREYRDRDEQKLERLLDFGHVVSEQRIKVDGKEQVHKVTVWDKAIEFWTMLASGNPNFKGVAEAFNYYINTHECPKCQGKGMIGPKPCTAEGCNEGLVGDGRDMANKGEKMGLIIKAWHAFLKAADEASKISDPFKQKLKEDELIKKYMHADKLKLETKLNQDTGEYELAEHPVVSGIDMGDPKDRDADEAIEEEEVTQESVEEEKKRIREENEAKERDKLKGRGNKPDGSMIPKAGDGTVIPPTAQDVKDRMRGDKPTPRPDPMDEAAKPLPPRPKAPTPKPAPTKPPLRGGV